MKTYFEISGSYGDAIEHIKRLRDAGHEANVSVACIWTTANPDEIRALFPEANIIEGPHDTFVEHFRQAMRNKTNQSE